MPADTWSANHSLLSPYLNLGLLHPREVVEAVLAGYAQGSVPLASCEGFIRQVIGWREYVNGLYWHFGDDYRRANALGATRQMPVALTEPGTTSMACVGSIVNDIDRRGWVHHIPRLMVLANLALIAGIAPAAFLAWMRRVFVDAADWVMVPNVIGMGVHADGGRMMTKPYAAGGAYISRMGRYCGSCAFDPRKRTGDGRLPVHHAVLGLPGPQSFAVRGQPAHGPAGARPRPAQRPAGGAGACSRRSQPSRRRHPVSCGSVHA